MKLTINNQEIELTDEQVAKLREVLSEEIVPKESEWYEPKQNENYWFCSSVGVAREGFERGTLYHERALRQRCYRTEEEVQQADRLRIAETAVNRYIIQNFGEFKPDWSDGNQQKYFMRYDHENKKYDFDYNVFTQDANKIGYLATREQAQQVIRDCEEHLNVLFGLDK